MTPPDTTILDNALTIFMIAMFIALPWMMDDLN